MEIQAKERNPTTANTSTTVDPGTKKANAEGSIQPEEFLTGYENEQNSE